MQFCQMLANFQLNLLQSGFFSSVHPSREEIWQISYSAAKVRANFEIGINCKAIEITSIEFFLKLDIQILNENINVERKGIGKLKNCFSIAQVMDLNKEQ